jgi:hypothetical protein
MSSARWFHTWISRSRLTTATAPRRLARIDSMKRLRSLTSLVRSRSSSLLDWSSSFIDWSSSFIVSSSSFVDWSSSFVVSSSSTVDWSSSFVVSSSSFVDCSSSYAVSSCRFAYSSSSWSLRKRLTSLKNSETPSSCPGGWTSGTIWMSRKTVSPPACVHSAPRTHTGCSSCCASVT